MQAGGDSLEAIVTRVVGRLYAELPDSERLAGVHVAPSSDRPGESGPVSQATPPPDLGRSSGRSLVVAVGSDHGGFEHKARVLEWIREAGHRAVDFGTHEERAVDYPDFALAVSLAVVEGRADVGVCLDGAGIGSAMAANKVPGIRAANGTSVAHAKNSREHNYANVLTLGARLLTATEMRAILLAFLQTPWGEARHGRRVEKINAIERGFAREQAPLGWTSPTAP